ncbi:hypothetical protein [Aeromicrobium sp. 9AM]|uniref:hypothetical protein n=1 Tax=Aeromicrobium sp. 9AM TaxID=2653126 RepID=UPI0012EF40DE|nr:hypothetical protein [Aeromicrobium sp. 9AM]VXC08800.1 hypothetical protein AERO9AM_50015 [Aeromicrobium sp. 9AM]
MATIEPRTTVVTIYQGDYLDRIRHLERKYEAALESEKSSSRPLAADGESSTDIADQHAELVAEAEVSALDIKVKALGRRKWRELVAAHPPREDSRSDQAVGVNEDTFKDVLIAASVVEPDLSEDDLDQLSDIDNDRLYFAAFALNRAEAPSPKAHLVSPTSTESDET